MPGPVMRQPSRTMREKGADLLSQCILGICSQPALGHLVCLGNQGCDLCRVQSDLHISHLPQLLATARSSSWLTHVGCRPVYSRSRCLLLLHALAASWEAAWATLTG